ncbi:MAG: glycosyltransferase family 4 protein [Anaerolineae bacterium]|nr:glycosyltransferase family 4 protein [Anaerolineae bacterium]
MGNQFEKRPLRICYFGTYRANYTRNQILLKGLRAQENVEVYECHATLWHSIDDRVKQASGGWRSPKFIGRVLKTYWQLFRAHNHTPQYDVMLIGYPGQFDTYLARLLTWWRRVPMALDILMSLHLVAEERGLLDKSVFTGKLIFWLEKGGLKLPNLLISENCAYENYYCQKYNLSPERFSRIPHGADDSVYHPRPISPPDDEFRVTYHGMYLPSHGLDTVIGAATQLQKETGIHFHFYGEGPEKERLEKFVRFHKLHNVTFHGFVSRDELLDGLARSHVCLGVFGETLQSHYTIQNKIWEGLAMGRPVISGKSELVQKTLKDGEQIYLVSRGNPQSLANGILTLKQQPEFREKLAQQGYDYYCQHNSPQALGKTLIEALNNLASGEL